MAVHQAGCAHRCAHASQENTFAPFPPSFQHSHVAPTSSHPRTCMTRAERCCGGLPSTPGLLTALGMPVFEGDPPGLGDALRPPVPAVALAWLAWLCMWLCSGATADSSNGFLILVRSRVRCMAPALREPPGEDGAAPAAAPAAFSPLLSPEAGADPEGAPWISLPAAGCSAFPAPALLAVAVEMVATAETVPRAGVEGRAPAAVPAAPAVPVLTAVGVAPASLLAGVGDADLLLFALPTPPAVPDPPVPAPLCCACSRPCGPAVVRLPAGGAGLREEMVTGTPVTTESADTGVPPIANPTAAGTATTLELPLLLALAPAAPPLR